MARVTRRLTQAAVGTGVEREGGKLFQRQWNLSWFLKDFEGFEGVGVGQERRKGVLGRGNCLTEITDTGRGWLGLEEEQHSSRASSPQAPPPPGYEAESCKAKTTKPTTSMTQGCACDPKLPLQEEIIKQSGLSQEGLGSSSESAAGLLRTVGYQTEEGQTRLLPYLHTFAPAVPSSTQHALSPISAWLR